MDIGRQPQQPLQAKARRVSVGTDGAGNEFAYVVQGAKDYNMPYAPHAAFGEVMTA